MAFKAAFIAHAPDADPARDRSVIDTGKYKLFTVVVKGQAQALETSKELVEKEGVQSILLCPGFTHKDIAEIQDVIGPEVGICVARGDAPGNRVAVEIIAKEWG